MRALAQSGLNPANCRLLDPMEALLNAGSPTSVLVLGFESADHPVTAWAERALEICRDHGGTPAEPLRVADDAGERPGAAPRPTPGAPRSSGCRTSATRSRPRA
ncbi:hypothetical protein ACFQ60_42830 [Streptomyces zhihengii]